MSNTTTHKFEVGQDENGNWRIGYFNQVKSIIDYNSRYGYLTAFAYALSVQNGRIWNVSQKPNMMGINLKCGNLDYATLPNHFVLKLGLTGSLKSASEREKDILLEKYKFERFSYIPSMFLKQKLKEIPAELVSGDDREAEFFNKIKDSMVDEVNKGRAVLVVLDDIKLLEQFWQFLKNHKFTGMDKLYKITGKEGTTKEKEHRIAQAARSKHMTLITRAFGRGSDFMCRDQQLITKGGMHVIQTFASELKSEEDQIKGRTCRQDDPGSYQQILFAKDLGPFFVQDLASFSHLDVLIEYNAWTPEETPLEDGTKCVSKLIDIKREEVLLEKKFQELNTALQKTQQDSAACEQFIEYYNNGEWDQARRLLCSFHD